MTYDESVPVSDPRGNKISVSLEQLQQIMDANKGQQGQGLVMQQGGQLVERPTGQQRRLTPQEQKELFLRAQAQNPYGKMVMNPDQNTQIGMSGSTDPSSLQELPGWTPDNPLQGITDEDVEAARRQRQEAINRANAEKEARKIEAQREKGDFSDELSLFLKSSDVYQDIKTKVASPSFYETFGSFFGITVATQFEKIFPITSKKHLRTSKPNDLEKKIGKDIVEATELKSLPREGRAMVWHFRPKDPTVKRNLFVICYDGRFAIVRKYEGLKIEERFIDDVIGLDIKTDSYAREVLYTEMLEEIQDLLGIEEDGD